AETLPVGGTWAESIFGNTFAGKPAPISWNALSATLWLTPAMVLALALILSAMHLSWELRKRRQATEASLLARFDAARRKAGLTRPIRLSISDRLQGPITFGFLRPEVVLPLRALDDLSAAQERSMFAHELAHVVRHDPAWFAGLALLERLFFFQPLLRVARKRLMEVAEERADDRAVAWTGNPVALASCLAEIARWILEGQRQRALPIAGMASSSLGNRIERLLVPQQPREARQHWFAPAVLALLVTTAGAAPRIGTGAEPVADVDAAWMAPSLHLNDTQIVEVDSSPEPQPNTELESVAPPQPEVAELHWKSLVNNEYALLEDELDLLADEIALLESELGADATEANRRALNLLSKRLEGLMHMRQIARALVLEVTKSSTSSATPHAQRGPR
ncbi:MAG: beta-lactamase regulating signal transducer with metallopeptidase domain, partial [Planctomycetota bacterium]